MKNHFVVKKGWIIAAFLTLVMVFGLVGTVHAAEFPPDGQIPAGETIQDDAFLTGKDVHMDGTVEGFLVASGQTVTINGIVHGDALAVGNTVVINEGAVIDGNLFTGAANIMVNGTVYGSLFGGSASIELGDKAKIGRNVYYGGSSLTAKSGSLIGKDMFSGAYQAILSGAIGRDATIGAGAIELYGSIGRNAKFEVGDEKATGNPEMMRNFMPGGQFYPTLVPAGIRISKDAKIMGNLSYTSSVNQTANFKAVTGGQITYQTPVPQNVQKYQPAQVKARPSLVGMTAWGAIRRLITLFVLGALAIWLLLKPYRKMVDAGYQQPLRAMGWGFIVLAVAFLAMLIVPIMFVLMAILLGFLSLGGLLFAWLGVVGVALAMVKVTFLFVIFTVSKIIAATIVGKWIVTRLFPKSVNNAWIVLFVGVLAYVFLCIIPVIGQLAGLAAALLGTGALWMEVQKLWNAPKKVKAK